MLTDIDPARATHRGLPVPTKGAARVVIDVRASAGTAPR
ncbi:hypothetical protein JSE7799_03055 [Jannaschia seosinensis]|uniref:Uncharacterized protein n=1 Tax=Jannaschia seosinensis TaxID=313367 RepID=A0A0M7BEK1_9RHOB|nr:hypothetical protein JSE7799_03055 [Jannaschia seosinensis]